MKLNLGASDATKAGYVNHNLILRKPAADRAQ